MESDGCAVDPGRNGRDHLWRIYDYPHIVLLYFRMYQIAMRYPEIPTALGAQEYLYRAYGTAAFAMLENGGH